MLSNEEQEQSGVTRASPPADHNVCLPRSVKLLLSDGDAFETSRVT